MADDINKFKSVHSSQDATVENIVLKHFEKERESIEKLNNSILKK